MMTTKIRTKYINDEVAEVARTLHDVSNDISLSFFPRLRTKEINNNNDTIDVFTSCLLNVSNATLPNDSKLKPGDIVCVYASSSCTLSGGGKLIRGSSSLVISSAAVFLIFDGERWH